MYTDSQLTFSAAQAVTATAFSTNTVDLLAAQDAGAGRPVYLVIRVGTAVTAAGAATVQFQLVSSANANLSSPSILGQSDAIGKANLGANTLMVVTLPKSYAGKPIGQRYLGLQYTVGTGPLTAGTFDAYLTPDAAGLKSVNPYPVGWSIK